MPQGRGSMWQLGGKIKAEAGARSRALQQGNPRQPLAERAVGRMLLPVSAA